MPRIQKHYVADEGTTTVFDETPAVEFTRASFRLSVGGWIGAAVVGFWLLMALFGPLLAPYPENSLPFPDAYGEYQAPQVGALLGTDVADRDVLSRVLYGAGRTIGISVAATLLAYLVGVLLGIGAAVSSPMLDMVLSRVVDAFMSLPTIMLALVVIALFGSSIPVLILTAGFIYSCIVFRLARAIGMDIAAMDFVEGARVRGERIWWIVVREIWPNAAIPLLSDFGLRLIFIVLFISSLSFLGLGVQPPLADWGSMVRENLGAFQSYEGSLSAVLSPAVAIASFTIAINLIVDDISAHFGGRFAGRM